MVGVEVGWSVVEEWLLSEVGIPACAFLRTAPGGAYGERQSGQSYHANFRLYAQFPLDIHTFGYVCQVPARFKEP